MNPILAGGLSALAGGALRTIFGPRPPKPPPPRLGVRGGGGGGRSAPRSPLAQPPPEPPRPNFLGNLLADVGTNALFGALTGPTVPSAAPVASTVPAAPAMGVPTPQTGQFGLNTTLGMDPRIAHAMSEQFGSPGLSASLVPPAAMLGPSGTPIGVQSALGDPTPLAHLRGAPTAPLRPWQTPSLPPPIVPPAGFTRHHSGAGWAGPDGRYYTDDYMRRWLRR